MNISVENTLTDKKAGTENSDIVMMNTSTNEDKMAGLRSGMVIFMITDR